MKKLRVQASQSVVVPLRLDAENEEFWKGEARLRLSRKPFAMLRLLVERRPKWVSKDDFYHAIWQPKEEDVMDWTFTTYVHEIRRALGDETSPHRYIETGVNRGYRFIGSFLESDRPTQSLETKTEEPPATPQLPQFKLAPNPQPPLPYVVGREAELEQLHRW
jgi:DNA-binding winged helix-turn-helix (wHTH) protein